MKKVYNKQYRGIRNNNPFNVIYSSENWIGKVPFKENTDGKFEQFTDMRSGIRCGMIVILNYIHKHDLHTVSQIINRFCPDFTAPSYIHNVCSSSFLRPDMSIDSKERFFVLCRRMMFVESRFDCPVSELEFIYNSLVPARLRLFDSFEDPFEQFFKPKNI